MATFDLKQHYHDYIAVIGQGCPVGPMESYVHDGVIHNQSAPKSVAEYSKMIADSQVYFPGLQFHVETLVIEPDGGEPVQANQGSAQVAVRIRLTFNPTGDKEEAFYEHVFYRFDKGKISRVWSMLDGAGLKWVRDRLPASQRQGHE